MIKLTPYENHTVEVNGSSKEARNSVAVISALQDGQHGVYWVVPILGAQLAVIVYGQLSNGFRDFK